MMWSAEMPSNIALIKYMGKKAGDKNIPTNASLSWTLDHLTTKVVIKKSSEEKDTWSPLETSYPFEMSPIGMEKYLGHFQRLKDAFGIKDNFFISSGNNFPADCGIASSASSFAALTEAASCAFSEISGKSMDRGQKAKLSSQGSGSSCRSFYNQWVHWDGEQIEKIDLNLENLHHMVVIAGDKAKTVSSSQAHKIVSTSALFEGRVERAEKRLGSFIKEARAKNWERLFQISWAEFWDMHALFETSEPSFGYFLPQTIEVLDQARSFWRQKKDGPLVTMDAGPNIHLLWREDQKSLAFDFFNHSLQGQWTCLSNIEGIGFAKV